MSTQPPNRNDNILHGKNSPCTQKTKKNQILSTKSINDEIARNTPRFQQKR